MKIKLFTGLTIEIDDSSCTASIIKSKHPKSHLYIPSFVIMNNKAYSLIKINDYAFANTHIKSIRFANNSQIKKFGKGIFDKSTIQSLSIPDSLEDLDEEWCKGTDTLTKILISSNNKRFSYIDEKILVNNQTNTLVFARRDLTELSVPSNIVRIGQYSFAHCSKLQVVTFPKDSKLRSIRANAFFYSSIKTMNIPSELQDLADTWCLQSNCLSELTISPSNTIFTYVDNKYLINNALKSLVFVRKDIEEAEIPADLLKIGNNAFAFCMKLKTVTFHDPVKCKIEELGDNAFSFCIKLESFGELPRSVKRIGRGCFSTCKHLQAINIPANSELRVIGEGAFQRCSIHKLFIPAKVSVLEEGWSKLAWNLDEIELSDENNNFELIDDSYLVTKTDIPILIYASYGLENATIPSKVQKIGKNSFSYHYKLRNVSFFSDPNSYQTNLVEIGDEAFMHCEKIKNITAIPTTVKRIGIRAFFACIGMKALTFYPPTDQQPQLEEIAEEAFSECAFKLESPIPATIRKIGKKAFAYCVSIKSISFAYPGQGKVQYLQEIEESAFERCELLTEIYDIPSSVKIIRKKAFLKCERLKSVTFSARSELRIMEKYAFGYCSSLEKIPISDKVEEIQETCFSHAGIFLNFDISHDNKRFRYLCNKMLVATMDNCPDENNNVLLFARMNVEKVQIPANVRRIGKEAFSSCMFLESVSFLRDGTKRTLCEIGKSAFANCGNLKNVAEIPNTVSLIEKQAFSGCIQLSSIQFQAGSELKLLGRYCFRKCPLTTFHIPAKLEFMDVYCHDEFKDITSLEIDPANQNFTLYDNKLLLKRDSTIDGIDGNDETIMFPLSNIDEVTIPTTVPRIEESLFERAQVLRKVNFASSSSDTNSKITEVAARAFYNCPNLEEIQPFPASIGKIGRKAFAKSKKLANVECLGENITLESQAFAGCEGLTKVSFMHASKLNIATNAFDDVMKKYSLALRDDVNLVHTGEKSSDEFSKLKNKLHLMHETECKADNEEESYNDVHSISDTSAD